jgi:hypothetical protein
MFGQIPSWSMAGIVQEVRGLGSKADVKAIWAWVIKVAAMGGTFELETRMEAMSKALGPGMMANFRGTFSQYGGALKLSLVSFDPIDPGSMMGVPSSGSSVSPKAKT